MYILGIDITFLYREENTSCDFKVVMGVHNVSTDQSFETGAHGKKGVQDGKVSGASEKLVYPVCPDREAKPAVRPS